MVQPRKQKKKKKHSENLFFLEKQPPKKCPNPITVTLTILLEKVCRQIQNNFGPSSDKTKQTILAFQD